MMYKKNLSLALVASIFVQMISPMISVSFADSPKTSINAKTSSSSSVRISKQMSDRLKKQQQRLSSLGNPSEYTRAEIAWDKTQNPSAIRNLRKKSSKNIVADTQAVLKDFSSLYGSGTTKTPDVRLKNQLVSKETNEKHARMKQYYNGLEIVNKDIIAHTDENGEIYQIDGQYAPGINISTVPKITANEALSIGQKEFSLKKEFKVSEKPTLVIYPYASENLLAWRYVIEYNDPKEGMAKWTYFVNAKSGKLLNSYNSIMHDSPVNLSGSAIQGEGGGLRIFSGTLSSGNGKYYMTEANTYKYSVYNYSTNTGTYTDAQMMANRTTTDWGTSDRTEVSAAYNLQKTLEYYKTLFNFGVGNITFSSTGQTTLPVIVHYGTNYNNAFWSPGVGLYLGDGDGITMASQADLDTIAHEFGHAWTENTSNLLYQNEPGALNESFSDISGVNVEFYAEESAAGSYPSTIPGKADWFISEDDMLVGTALRDLRNPANSVTVGSGNEQPTRYFGTHWYFGSLDAGGIHQNSGVQNYFYYLLSEGGTGNNDGILYSVDGIGLANARRIAYEANTNFMPSTATYTDSRQAWIDAANSINPAFVPSVIAAWDAVGVFGTSITPVLTSDESFETSTALPLNWSTSSTGSTAWSVVTNTGSAGNNSLQSGVIGNSGSTSVYWSGAVNEGALSFSYRTSSEAGYDGMVFFVDGIAKASWSGINPWTFYHEPISEGSHTLEWRYLKDGSDFFGLDQAGIDAVHFSSLSGSVSLKSTFAQGEDIVSGSGFSALVDIEGSGSYMFYSTGGLSRHGYASGTTLVPLSGFQDGTGSFQFQYRNNEGFVSPVITKTFFLDSIAPTAPVLTSPVSGFISNTGTIDFGWTPTTDTGAGVYFGNPLDDFNYTISIFSNTGILVTSGQTDLTSSSLAELSDGIYTARISTRDLAHNPVVSQPISFIVDTTSPDIPTNVVINNNDAINSANQAAVTLIGSGGISESGSVAHYTLSNGTITLSGSTQINSAGSFVFTPIDTTSMGEGILNYSVWMVDVAGNIGTPQGGSVVKSLIPIDGNIQFLSGSHTSTPNVDILLSAGKAVSYELSGSGLATALTGSLGASGSVTIPVVLSNSDGLKTIQTTFTDALGAISNTYAFITLDTLSPNIIVSSHTDNHEVTGSSATLTGTFTDAGGLASLSVCGTSLSLINPWSTSCALAGGDNTLSFTATDLAGNSGSGQIHLRRIAQVTSVMPFAPTSTSLDVDFDTDLVSTGVLVYGTSALNLSDSVFATSANGLIHNATITGLTQDTVYYYQAFGVNNGFTGQLSLVYSFRTPRVLDITTPVTQDIFATGAITLSGASSTGAVFTSSDSGSIALQSSSGSDSLVLSLSGLSISSTSWNGIIEAPYVYSLTGPTIPDTGYTQTGVVYKAGNNSSPLAFTGQTPTLTLNVGAILNGISLKIYRSDDNISYTPIGTCVVASGKCVFPTNHFSYFTFGLPADSTPDIFSFASQANAELFSAATSASIMVSGINASASISITGGSYSVNNGAYTSSGGFVVVGDTVSVRLTTSSAYSSAASTHLTIGGVASSFSVTTKSAPVSSGGGGGGSSISKDNCPSGDSSPSYYDGNCGSVVKVGTTNVATTSSSTVTPSGLLGTFFSAKAFEGIDFSPNKALPQKVYAEINFFAKKIMDIIAKKNISKEKTNLYYTALSSYFSKKAQLSDNTKSKRIYTALANRFLFLQKQFNGR